MLSESEQASIEAACKSLCPSWPPADIEVEQYLVGGYRNRNYRLKFNGKRYALRIAEGGSESEFTREQQLHSALATVFPHTSSDLTLDVAPVVAACASEGLLLSRWISAPLLAASPGVTAETLGIYLARLHCALGRIPRENVSRGDLKSHIRSDLTLASGSEESAERWVAALPEPQHSPIVCHLDLNPWNLLVTESHWVTLDWETVALADPLFDLVNLCDGYLREHDLQEDRTAFSDAALRAYNLSRDSADPDYTNDALSGARSWYQWREYAWAHAQIAAGNNRQEIILQRDFFAAELVQRGFDIT